MLWGPTVILLLYGNFDLEEIQFCENIFFILFYWGNPSHAKILSFYLYLPIIYPSFVAPASEGLHIYFDKDQKILHI